MVFFWESKQQTNLRFIPFLVMFLSCASAFTRIFTRNFTRFAVCLKKPIVGNGLTPILAMNFKRFSVPLFSFSSVGVAGGQGVAPCKCICYGLFRNGKANLLLRFLG
jgi:hypothetical protein